MGFRKAGDLQDFAASFVASILTVIALPTVWFVSFDFIDLTRMTVLVFGLAHQPARSGICSAPSSVSVPGSWGTWIRAYLSVCVVWTLAQLRRPGRHLGDGVVDRPVPRASHRRIPGLELLGTQDPGVRGDSFLPAHTGVYLDWNPRCTFAGGPLAQEEFGAE